MERKRNEKEAPGAEKDGIRKAALFLSILDAEAADALLSRFEPNVARAIEAEARRVGSVAPEDVDAIVAEFLALSESEESPRESEGRNEGTQSSERNALFDGRRNDCNEFEGRNAWNDGGSGDGGARLNDFNGRDDWESRDERGVGELLPLDAIEPERLARLLSGASRTTIAVALARLSERRRSAVVALLPSEKAEGARRAFSALVRRTDAARSLEDALFNGALDDE